MTVNSVEKTDGFLIDRYANWSKSSSSTAAGAAPLGPATAGAGAGGAASARASGCATRQTKRASSSSEDCMHGAIATVASPIAVGVSVQILRACGLRCGELQIKTLAPRGKLSRSGLSASSGQSRTSSVMRLEREAFVFLWALLPLLFPDARRGRAGVHHLLLLWLVWRSFLGYFSCFLEDLHICVPFAR